MSDFDPTRRQFGIGLGTLLSVPLAGCMGDDGEPAGTETEPGTDTPTETDTESGTTTGTETQTETEAETTTEGEPVPDGQSLLAVRPEDENGELVEIGIDLTLQHTEYEDESTSRSYVGDWDEMIQLDGDYEWEWARLRAEPITILYAGEYALTIEPNEANDFEPVEETVEITGEELGNAGAEEIMKEVTVVLEGATSDAERARREATLMDGRYRLDANHDHETEWAWGVRDASEEAGAHVEQQHWEEADHQRWDFEPVDEEGKWHRIVAAHTDALVWGTNQDTEQNQDFETWTTVETAEWAETDDQLWRITPLTPDHRGVEEGDELYKIENKANGAAAYLDIAGGNLGQEENEAGLPVVTWWYASDADQQIQFHEQ